MSAPSVPLRVVGVSGAEALRLVEGSIGRPVRPEAGPDHDPVRPARVEYGRLAVRTRAPAAAVPARAMYHLDEIRGVRGTGTTVTVSGPAAMITDPDETARPHCLKGMRGAPIRRTPTTWADGPHDTLLRRRPTTDTGLRLTRAEV
ncbi:pyridoxamine 5'-phosphate oxidase family protein [Streptomyces sp. ATMOS53]